MLFPTPVERKVYCWEDCIDKCQEFVGPPRSFSILSANLMWRPATRVQRSFGISATVYG